MKNREVRTPSTLVRIAVARPRMLDLSMLLNIFSMSAWETPRPANQDFNPASWFCISSAYCGRMLANRAIPMIAETTSPMMIANTPMTTTNVASQRGAPRRIIMPRNGSTVMVRTRARKMGAMICGTACMPATTITAAARPSPMIKPRGRLYPARGGGGLSMSCSSWSLTATTMSSEVASVAVLGSSLMVMCPFSGVVPRSGSTGRRRKCGSAGRSLTRRCVDQIVEAAGGVSR